MNKKIKVAIIGFGVMGKNHLRTLKKMADLEMVAICDPHAKNIGETVYSNLSDLLRQEQLDAAIIATPTSTHKEVALQCIDAGIHILVEKPIASTTKEGLEIWDAAKKKGVQAAVGHVERFNPVVGALKSELKNREVFSINITRVGPFPPRISDVGVLTDLAVHDIDLIKYITGKNILKASIFKSKKIHNHHEDNATLSFQLEDEIVANITTNWLTPYKKRSIEVATKHGYFEANLMSQELAEFSSYKDNNSYVVKNVFVKKEEPLVGQATDFFKCLRGDSSCDLATLPDGIDTLEVIEKSKL